MPFVSALSRHPETATAIGEVVGQLLDRAGPDPDLAVLFLTPGHLPLCEAAAATVQTVLNPAVFVGTSAAGVLASDEAVETRPGVALWAAWWPHRRGAAAAITPHTLEASRDALSPDGWTFSEFEIDDATAMDSALLLLADPFSFPVDVLLPRLRGRYPSLPVIGGLASAAHSPTGNRLVIGGRVIRSGAVAVTIPRALLHGEVVSQGCRPIGNPMTVTKSMDNVLYEIAGRPALDVVLELVESLGPADRALAELGLHCGIVVDNTKLDFERGDFLIRGVLGASREHRAVVIGDSAPIGTTVQFQVRDAVTAAEDLEFLLLAQSEPADGALLFTCNGRGEAMFGSSAHDAEIVSRGVRDGVAGMFCAGEIGPIGTASAVHGFTASVALFRE